MRRRRSGHTRRRADGEGEEPDAAGAPRRLQRGRRRSESDGHRPSARHSQRIGQEQTHAQRHRPGRGERSVRRAIARRQQRARPRSGQDERERRRDRPRTSAGRIGLAHHRSPCLRAGASQGQVRHRQRMHWRRPGHRHSPPVRVNH